MNQTSANLAPVPAARQPVIILGAHRSGTSMVARLLDRLGLFVGCDLQANHESNYFLEINEMLLRRVNAAWDNPTPMRDFLACEPVVNMTSMALRADLMSRRIAAFLGESKSLKSFDRPWGWKDPRTVFTLPLWLRLFPGARVVHIVRNGVDVAASLQAREQKLLQQRAAEFDERMDRAGRRTCLETAGYKGSARCLTLEGAFELWCEYRQQSEEILQCSDNTVCTIRYEDFVASPARHLGELAKFCGLAAAKESAVCEAAAGVNAERATAFTKDAHLAAFYATVKDNTWMATHRNVI